MNIGEQEFRNISADKAYVDKTLLIKEILTSKNTRFLVTAPRRFGKSINLSMLRRFFEILDNEEEQRMNRESFKGLLIEKEKNIMNNYFGKYPVIFLNFLSGTPISSIQAAVEKICVAVQRAYKEHAYLSTSDKLEDYEKEECAEWRRMNFRKNPVKMYEHINTALTNLAEYLKKHWQKSVLVLIDEYDSICSSSIIYTKDIPQLDGVRKYCVATDEIQEVIAVTEGTIEALLKISKDVERAFVTGISYLTSKGLSKLNTIQIMKFQEESAVAPFYGLTVNECKNLLTKFNLASHLEELKQYYDGYRNEMLSIFSVIEYLNMKTRNPTENALQNYWTDSGLIAEFNNVVKIIRARTIIFKLLNADPSNEIKIKYYKTIVTEKIVNLKNILSVKNIEAENLDIYFNFLLEQGYLKITHFNEKERKVKVKIPNTEIACVFRDKLEMFFVSDDFNLNEAEAEKCAGLFDKLRTSNEINRKLLQNIKDTLNEMIRKINFGVKNEYVLHHILYFVLMKTSNFRFLSEVRASKKNRKRIDLLLLNDNFGIGIIIEMKYNDTAEVALDQIIAKNYTDAFTYDKYTLDNFYLQYSLLIGLNVDENQNITLCVLFNTTDLENYVNYD